MTDRPEPSTQTNSPALPRQLQKQLADTAALYAEGNPAAVVVPDPAITIVEAPAGTMPAAAAAPAAVAVPVSPGVEGGDSWEQRYNSLKGRFDQSNKDKQALGDRLANMELVVARLQASGANPPAETPAQTQQRLISEEEEADYGTDMLDVVGRRAQELISPELAALAARLQKMESRVDGVATVTAKSALDNLYDKLGTAVPNWQEINVDAGFKSWVEAEDEYSGERRMDLLNKAFTRHDADRVIKFFKGYTEATGTPTAQQQVPGAPPLATNGDGSGQRTTLLDLAAPGRARSAPDPLSPEKPMYTSADITKFYADARKGKYNGREADFKAIEADIFVAQREGRIQV